MALVFLVLCQGHPEHLADLLALLHDPAHRVLLHVDRKAPHSLHQLAGAMRDSFPQIHVLPSDWCSWGGYSLVETTLRGMEYAVARLGDWSHLVLVSEHHLPLRPPAEMAARLEPGVSDVPADRVAGMSAEAQADIAHRFAMHCRELPGVGSFATRPRAVPSGWLEGLHQGTQWMALSREACAALATRRAGPELAPFRDALLADELALQSVLMAWHAAGAPGLRVRHALTTFVAWPHLGGSPAMEFSEGNFAEARAGGYLFIRKRPAGLPPAVAAAIYRASGVPLSCELPPAPARRPAPEVRDWAGALLAALHGAGQPAEMRMFSPEIASCPKCFLGIRLPGMPPALEVAVLSEDMEQFKVALIHRGGPPGFAPIDCGGRQAVVLRVRVFSLFGEREILLPGLLGDGFVPRQAVAVTAHQALSEAARLDDPARATVPAS